MKQDILHSAIDHRDYPNEINVVSVILNLQDIHHLKVSSFYNPNGSNDIKAVLEEEIREKNTVVFGDLNAHSTLWETCVHSNTAGKNIEEFILSSNNFTVLTLHGLPNHYNIRNNTASMIDLQIGPTWLESEVQISPVLNLQTDHTATLVKIHASKYTSAPPTSTVGFSDTLNMMV
jgi:hypothetical protein